MIFAFLFTAIVAHAALPEPIALNAKDEAALIRGDTLVRDSGKGMAVGILDVAAPPSRVWAEVLNVEPRVQEVGASTGCEVYHRGQDAMKVKWGIGMLGMSASFHLVYVVDHDNMVFSYTLDTTKENDIAYAVGSYQVVARGAESRLIYRSEADPNSKIPGWVRSILTGRPLRQQLQGIKARAEAQ